MLRTANVVKLNTYPFIIASILLATCGDIATGQLISPIVAARGATPRGCRLTNLSCGANWDSPVDATLPTFVITHGYNPLPNRINLTNPQAYALKIRERFGARVNVLAFHWDSRGQGNPLFNNLNAIGAGNALAHQLMARGVNPENTAMIGHSMGTVVVTSAANCMFYQTGVCTRKLTLLDGPKRRLSLLIDDLEATRCATEIQNFWAGGLSGLGAPIHHPLVTNVQAPLRQPQRTRWGFSNPARNNHVDILLWYYDNYL